MKVFRHLWKK